MRTFLEIALTGVASAAQHRMRSAVTIVCLIAVLLPHLLGMAILHGLRGEARHALENGADLYVSAQRFGRKAPLPAAVRAQLEAIPGVTSVAPRIVGEVFLGKDQTRAVLVGMPVAWFPPRASIVEGRLPAAGTMHELVVGTELARELKLKTGALLPPFYHSAQGERVSRVVGILRREAPLWQSRMILASLETAQHVFDQPGLVTEFLVECRPGYVDRVRGRVQRTVDFGAEAEGLRIATMTRDDMRAFLPRAFLHHEGVLNLHVVLLVTAAVLVVMLTSGLGLSERRREIGILKATGWQTDEILLRSFSEGLVLSALGASTAWLLAYVWLRLFNGYWIASVFLAGVAVSPSFVVPFRFLPVPALLAAVLSFVMVMSGSLYSSWRAATVPPASAMR